MMKSMTELGYPTFGDFFPQPAPYGPPPIPQPVRFTVRRDPEYGSWGVWDVEEERFAGHSGTEHGARALRRNMARQAH